MDAEKVQEFARVLNVAAAAIPPAVQRLRRCAEDVKAVADTAELLAETCRALLAHLGQSPIQPARPELRVVTPPSNDAG